jgi:hypothetical protein
MELLDLSKYIVGGPANVWIHGFDNIYDAKCTAANCSVYISFINASKKDSWDDVQYIVSAYHDDWPFLGKFEGRTFSLAERYVMSKNRKIRAINCLLCKEESIDNFMVCGKCVLETRRQIIHRYWFIGQLDMHGDARRAIAMSL